ncbi:hypothetical protein NC652_002483 [Populus alba x Populus x berolinensis]|nr:hypothetical protein NC652_002483 [Populus alba x Populus x berolinensis]
MSWEFCARRHEELIPRRLLIPQAATQTTSSNLSILELQNNYTMFVASARQLAKALEVPLVNDLGYTKRYVRCLQISEVTNSMKDLVDYSREIGTGPMEFGQVPSEDSSSSGFHSQAPQPEGQQQQQQLQTIPQNSNSDRSSAQVPMQITTSNGMASVNNSLTITSTTTSAD